MFGVSRLPAPVGLWLMGLGLVGVGVFIVWEKRARYPVFNLGLFTGSRTFTFSCVAALIHYSATFAVTFLVSLYLQYIKGAGPRTAGYILIAQPVMMAIFSPLAGRLSDNIEPRTVASLGMAVTTVGLASLVFLGNDSSVGFVMACLLTLGLGVALFSSPNTNVVMGSVDRRFYGLASGSVGTMRLLGMMTSMGIATVIFTLVMGRVQITPEHHAAFLKGVRLAFIVFSALCFLGTFCSLARGRMRQGQAAGSPSERA